MFTLIKKVGDYLLGPTKEDQDSDVIDIDSIISVIEKETVANVKINPVAPEGTDHNVCQQRIGTVTALHENSGLIDGQFFFDLRDVHIDKLKVGDRVEYLAFRHQENEEWRVRKIYSIIEDTWDTHNASNIGDEFFSKQSEISQIKSKSCMGRSIVGKVSERNGREIIINPEKIRCNLDDVSAEFTPLKGDWVVLEALVEINEEVCDLGGEVLEVQKISSLRSRIVTGNVTQWNPEGTGMGVIDKNVFFFKDSCEPGYLPCLGDKVVAEAIESEQANCNWRALTVVPLLFSEKNGKYSLQANGIVNATKNAFRDADVLLQDKNDITITENLEFGSIKLGERKEIIAVVKNSGTYKQILLRGKFHSCKNQSQFFLQSPKLEEHVVIYPGQTVDFHFSCKGRFIGHSSELFVFTFKGFKIGRNLQVEVKETVQDSSLFLGRNENVKNHFQKRIYDPRNRGIRIAGQRPIKPPAFVPVKLGVFPVPDRFWDVVLGSNNEKRFFEDIEMDLQTVAPCLMSDLNISNYTDRFHTLLYLEEIQNAINMQNYDVKRACFRLAGPSGEFLALAIPGLAERRPSLLLGDKVIATNPFEEQDERRVEYEGFIHKVFSSEIWVKFNSNFHSSYNGGEYNVTFTFSRTSYRRCHAALNLALTHLGPQMLFPTKINLQPPQLHIKEQEHNYSDNQYNNLSISETGKGTFKNFSNISPPLTELSVVERLFGMKNSPGMDSSEEQTNKENFEIPVADGKNSECVGRNLEIFKTDKNTLKNEPFPDFQKRNLRWFNSFLNRYQKDTVLNILNGEARPLPYVIFGPPGTGKTVTLVEAILQILTLLPDSRMLVATPSNSSANLIAERLLDSGMLVPGDLVRLVGYHCIEEGTIPERLVPYSTTGDIRLLRGEDNMPRPLGEPLKLSSNAKTLGRHRITIGTCVALGQLYIMGFKRGHFTHVLVDEAGQATEPEIMIPLSFIHTSCGQVVLAGDPMQLGPVIISPSALKMGLAESFLVRLLHRAPYQRDLQGFPDTDGYNPRLVTKLAMNYRSVPEILNVPNALFYNSYLQPQVSQTVGPEADILSLLAEELPKRSKEKGGPPAVVFHGIRGNNYQEEGSPSWFNPQEAVQVMYYVNVLYSVGLLPEDIGIITPYQKQVQKLRSMLEEFEVPIPKIGSVEEFQGQERKVIILSAVRSTPSLVKTDIYHSLGFIASPKRLNVALTRARALLIILGNPHLLARDPYWRSMLNFCVEQGSYTGCDLPTNYTSYTEIDEDED
ncbi:hypothetical protein L9F63_022134 [Diploptera punctata]|uniref:RNA helicase n=1 Tax=Diploptera punctata TaxID=6984 RepID=A0AAD7ZNC4_DIPPU|nr:hypothetical protein L9F63_022134 [Diploptera punctata]